MWHRYVETCHLCCERHTYHVRHICTYLYHIWRCCNMSRAWHIISQITHRTSQVVSLAALACLCMSRAWHIISHITHIAHHKCSERHHLRYAVCWRLLWLRDLCESRKYSEAMTNTHIHIHKHASAARDTTCDVRCVICDMTCHARAHHSIAICDIDMYRYVTRDMCVSRSTNDMSPQIYTTFRV